MQKTRKGQEIFPLHPGPLTLCLTLRPILGRETNKIPSNKCEGEEKNRPILLVLFISPILPPLVHTQIYAALLLHIVARHPHLKFFLGSRTLFIKILCEQKKTERGKKKNSSTGNSTEIRHNF